MPQTTGNPQPTSPAKDSLVQKLASKLNVDPKHVETIVDGTISEIFSPTALGSAAREMCNGCNNGCSGKAM